MLRFQTVSEMLPARPMDAKKASKALSMGGPSNRRRPRCITDIRTSTLASHDLEKSITALMTCLNEEFAAGNGGR